MRGTQRQKKAKKDKKSIKNRGKGKEWKTTPITDKKELKRLEDAERIAAERERNDNEIIYYNYNKTADYKLYIYIYLYFKL